MVFKIFRTSTNYAQKYWWVVAAANGEKLASSEMYYNKSDCLHAINLVKSCASDADVMDLT